MPLFGAVFCCKTRIHFTKISHLNSELLDILFGLIVCYNIIK